MKKSGNSCRELIFKSNSQINNNTHKTHNNNLYTGI